MVLKYECRREMRGTFNVHFSGNYQLRVMNVLQIELLIKSSRQLELTIKLAKDNSAPVNYSFKIHLQIIM